MKLEIIPVKGKLINHIELKNDYGDVLFKKQINANIIDSAFSVSGKLISIITARSDNEEYSNSFVLIDAVNDNIVFFNKQNKPNQIKFKGEKLYASYNYGDFLVDSSGNVKNNENRLLKCIKHAGSDAIYAAREYLKGHDDTESANIVVNSMKLYIEESKSKPYHEESLSQAFKTMGEGYEALRDNQSAYNSYKAAIKINGKIKLKSKITSLLKKGAIDDDSYDNRVNALNNEISMITELAKNKSKIERDKLYLHVKNSKKKEKIKNILFIFILIIF
ncbi:MAG: hypothetical protein EKE20_17500 [Candidatus Symbiopectobacterium sp. Dall1.0]|nr:hypothetical protein [Candidatus Symbiopectobacterium sp. Dall1.0]